MCYAILLVHVVHAVHVRLAAVLRLLPVVDSAGPALAGRGGGSEEDEEGDEEREEGGEVHGSRYVCCGSWI